MLLCQISLLHSNGIICRGNSLIRRSKVSLRGRGNCRSSLYIILQIIVSCLPVFIFFASSLNMTFRKTQDQDTSCTRHHRRSMCAQVIKANSETALTLCSINYNNFSNEDVLLTVFFKEQFSINCFTRTNELRFENKYERSTSSLIDRSITI